MSYTKVSGVVAAVGTALALVGSAYGDPGKSANGAPGPAGNPNQPAAQTEANAPQGPQGNSGTTHGQSGSAPGHNKTAKAHEEKSATHGKSGTAHGNSGTAHGDSGTAHGKSGTAHAKQHANEANPNPATPRKEGRTDRPAGKITICHATKSETNPYVEITISVNGLHGHSHHHAGEAWDDIIPAPKDGCPPNPPLSSDQKPGAATQPPAGTTANFVAAAPEVAATAPAGQAVLGAQYRGASAPASAGVSAPASAGTSAPDDESAVLGAQASGSTPPASAVAARQAGGGSLPFTGSAVGLVLIAAAAVLIAGFALRRALTSR